jgi:hypothetical protein
MTGALAARVRFVLSTTTARPRVTAARPALEQGRRLGALGDIGVEVLREDPRWQERPPRLLLTVDECYVIARDVWMDVPEFDHPDDVYVGA